MDFNFTALTTRQKVSACYDLQEFCSGAQSIEQIVLYWVSPTRSLVLSLSEEYAPKQLGVSFFEHSQLVGYAATSIRQLQAQYGPWSKLNETIHLYCDCDNYSADAEWFDSRNSRLSLVHYEDDQTLLGPPSALAELVLSYAFSSCGFAKIRECLDENSEPEYILTELVYLGRNHQKGWEEPVLFNRNQLRRYCDIVSFSPPSPYMC